MTDMYGNPIQGGVYQDIPQLNVAAPQWAVSDVFGHIFGTRPDLPPGYTREEFNRERAMISGHYIGAASLGLATVGIGATLSHLLYFSENPISSVRQSMFWGSNIAPGTVLNPITAARVRAPWMHGSTTGLIGSMGKRLVANSDILVGGLREAGRLLGWSAGQTIGGAAELAMRGTAWGAANLGYNAMHAMSPTLATSVTRAAHTAGSALTGLATKWARHSAVQATIDFAMASGVPESVLEAMRSAPLRGTRASPSALKILASHFKSEFADAPEFARYMIREASAAARSAPGALTSAIRGFGEFIRSPIKYMGAGGGTALRSIAAAGGAALGGFIIPAAVEGYAFHKLTQPIFNEFEDYMARAELEKSINDKSDRILRGAAADPSMGYSGGFTAAQRARTVQMIDSMAKYSTKGADMFGFGAGGLFGGHDAYSARFRELSNMFNIGADTGALRSRDMQEFEKKFKELVDTTDRIGQILRQGKEKIAAALAEMKTLGFSTGDAGNNLVRQHVMAGMMGVPPEAMMAMTQAGAQVARQMQWGGRTGGIAFQDAAMFVKRAIDRGMYTQETVAQAGGEHQLAMKLGIMPMNYFEQDPGMQTAMMKYVKMGPSGTYEFDTQAFWKGMREPVTEESARRSREERESYFGINGTPTAKGIVMQEGLRQLKARGVFTPEMMQTLLLHTAKQDLLVDPKYAGGRYNLQGVVERVMLQTGLSPEEARPYALQLTGAMDRANIEEQTKFLINERKKVRDTEDAHLRGIGGFFTRMYYKMLSHGGILDLFREPVDKTHRMAQLYADGDPEKYNAMLRSQLGGTMAEVALQELDFVKTRDLLAFGAAANTPFSMEQATSRDVQALYLSGVEKGTKDDALIRASEAAYMNVMGSPRGKDLTAFVAEGADAATLALIRRGLSGNRVTFSSSALESVGRVLGAARTAMEKAAGLTEAERQAMRAQFSGFMGNAIFDVDGTLITPERRLELELYAGADVKDVRSAKDKVMQSMTLGAGRLLSQVGRHGAIGFLGGPVELARDLISNASEDTSKLLGGLFSVESLTEIRKWKDIPDSELTSDTAAKLSLPVGPGGAQMTRAEILKRAAATGNDKIKAIVSRLLSISRDNRGKLAGLMLINPEQAQQLSEAFTDLGNIRRMEGASVAWDSAKKFTKDQLIEAEKSAKDLVPFFKAYAQAYAEGKFDDAAMGTLIKEAGRLGETAFTGKFGAFRFMVTSFETLNKDVGTDKYAGNAALPYLAKGMGLFAEDEKGKAANLAILRNIAEKMGISAEGMSTEAEIISELSSTKLTRPQQKIFAEEFSKLSLHAHTGLLAQYSPEQMRQLGDRLSQTPTTELESDAPNWVRALMGEIDKLSKSNTDAIEKLSSTAAILDDVKKWFHRGYSY